MRTTISRFPGLSARATLAAVVITTISLALVLFAPPAGATAQGSPGHNQNRAARPAAKVPRKDHFTGHVTSATGAYRSEHGRMILNVHLTRSGITVRVAPLACHRAEHCLRLAGTLRGTVKWLRTIPDTAPEARLKLRGNLDPLGTVTARGTVWGTGFIRFAHEGLVLTLSNKHGRVGLVAQIALVPGFTIP